MENESHFKQHQKELLQIINSDAGRYLLGIKRREPILKITPSSIHFLRGLGKEGVHLTGQFFGYEKFAKWLMPSLAKKEIAQEEWFKKPVNNLDAFLHFSGLQNKPGFPDIFLAGTAFYSAAGDGQVYNNPGSGTWTQCRDATDGTVVNYTDAVTYFVIADPNPVVGRSFYPFNTASLTAAAIITTGANKFHWQFNSWGADVGTRPTITIVASTVTSTTVLALADFNNFGTTEFTNTRFDTAGKVADTDYTITLNTSGDAAISKTSFTKFCIRTNFDIDNSAPAGGSAQEILSYYSEQSGTSKDPYLEINYFIPGGGMLFGM